MLAGRKGDTTTATSRRVANPHTEDHQPHMHRYHWLGPARCAPARPSGTGPLAEGRRPAARLSCPAQRPGWTQPVRICSRSIPPASVIAAEARACSSSDPLS